MQGREGNSTSLTALGVLSATEDAGCPRLVGRRLVALRQHLPTLDAHHPLQLYSHTAQNQIEQTIAAAATGRNEDRARNGETDLRDGDGQVELARADVLHAGAAGGSVLVLGQLHVLRRVAAPRLRHCRPLLASPPRVFGLPTKGRAARSGVGTGASGGVRSVSRRVHGQVTDGSAEGHHAKVTFAFLF